MNPDEPDEPPREETATDESPPPRRAEPQPEPPELAAEPLVEAPQPEEPPPFLRRVDPDPEPPGMFGEPEVAPPPPPEPEPPPPALPPEPEPPAVYLRRPAPEPEIVHDPDPERHYEPEPPPAPPQRPPRRDVFDGPEREPDIPMPGARRGVGDKRRARDARINLDLDLGRIKRRKRYGFFMTLVSVLFIAFVLAPVTWVGAYMFADAPSTILMMQRAAEGETIRHYPIPINRMSPHIIRAVIAAEDSNFCTHDGFDIEAIQDAMQANARGSGVTRGASTISQQTAKNLFLWPERSWVRKGFETYFTALIEFIWPKRRIMEHYLNVAEWGDGNFGIEAAARARFGVSAADLTPLQAARLAAVLPLPNEYSADSPGPHVRQRSATIVGRARVVRNERLAACALFLDRSRE